MWIHTLPASSSPSPVPRAHQASGHPPHHTNRSHPICPMVTTHHTHVHTHRTVLHIAQITEHTQTSPKASDTPASHITHVLCPSHTLYIMGSHLPTKSHASVSSIPPDMHPTHRSSRDHTRGSLRASHREGLRHQAAYRWSPPAATLPQPCMPSLLPESGH